MLVYADGPPSPRTHLVPSAQVELQVRHLDLSAPPAGILAQLDAVAEDIRKPLSGDLAPPQYQASPA